MRAGRVSGRLVVLGGVDDADVQVVGAAELHFDTGATAAPSSVSAPQPGGYPYGSSGAAQRARDFRGSKAQGDLITGGSDAPLGLP